jgi:hypothetical protein
MVGRVKRGHVRPELTKGDAVMSRKKERIRVSYSECQQFEYSFSLRGQPQSEEEIPYLLTA